MSRIGKKPITLPVGVEVKVGLEVIEVKGPKGSIITPVHPTVVYDVKADKVIVNAVDESRMARSQHGLRRTLLANCIKGVTLGFKETLEVIGVGYKVSVVGNIVELMVGLSHPVHMDMPKGIIAATDGNKLIITGIDKQLVGEVAATIRCVRPPEPFKGKGIKYLDEIIRRKAGKSGGKK
ncbi:50S ribosomal protein L6 [Desulfovibrionales bacterium]